MLARNVVFDRMIDLNTTDYATARPAAIFVIDLVKHSARPVSEIQQIQKTLEATLKEALAALGVSGVITKYTGDGYVCAFVGDSSARIVDFINIAFPELKRRLEVSKQAFRAGIDFGLIRLRPNQLTGELEHFDRPGIQASRLESAAQPNQILCTQTVCEIFASLYPDAFACNPITVQTKDRQILAFEIHPFDFADVQRAFSDYIFGPLIDSAHTAQCTGRIMVVDDEPTVREMLRMSLLKIFPKVEVLTVDSGEAALALFEPGKINAVITDCVMLGLSGVELTERILSLDQHVVLMMMTGFPSEISSSRFYEVGGFRFFAKPFEIEFLRRTIEYGLSVRSSQLFASLRAVSDKPGRVLRELQQISDSLLEVLRCASREDHIAQTLLRHKVKHTVAEFVKSVRPGNDVLGRAECVRVQMYSLQRLAWDVARAEGSSFPSFLKQYLSDLKKRHRNLRTTLKTGQGVESAIKGQRVEMVLGLVVCELIDNAIAAMSENGSVLVDMTFLPSIRQLKVVVQDKGPGVAGENVSHLFDQGYSTKGPGRGLGLYLVKEAIERLGGTITYEFVAGARFTVFMPLVV